MPGPLWEAFALHHLLAVHRYGSRAGHGLGAGNTKHNAFPEVSGLLEVRRIAAARM